ncbi:hypothetical protein RH831_04445 [Halodesulfurarchaeum sp. HSR-GB]|uniref:hypothetical protein n=1 Tax=Halodesulfurarchaeum sp. HSR-GB TaxID=3074077 RepID=UPI002862C1B7|nr:hypothetical protein [Halodesulfurarchaeum sp. HSR-GB]MDR5656429.1 hypothetical protein [Halodesulfurarchaeum sp. HSR-GB]
MRRRTLAILVLVAVVLAPTWFAAIQAPGEHAGAVGIDTSQTDMRPLQPILETPAAFTPAQVGVIIFLVLGVLMAILAALHRAMHGTGGTADPEDPAPWFQTEHRWLASYGAAPESADGLAVILGLMLGTVALSGLTVMEFVTLARTQYVGLYVGGIFLTLAGATAAYSAWFLPEVTVAEERYHG